MAERVSLIRKFFISARRAVPYQRTVIFLRRRPFISFLLALGLLLFVIAISNLARTKSQTTQEKPEVVKSVQIYEVSESPKLSVQAKIEKTGVLKISSQMPGIVQKVHVTEGQSVKKGTLLISLSTNYQGGSAPSLQRQLAYVQFKNVKDTYDIQKDIITKQQNITTASAQNTEELRKISEKSLSETRDLLTLNENLLNSVNTQIRQLEQNSQNSPELPVLRGQQAQLQAGVNQIRSSVRAIEYQTNTSNPPTLLSDIQKEIALKQLEIQQKALDLNKDLSRIQLNLAAINESLMFPVAPFSGIVERVHVSEGQSVNPGMELITMTSDQNEITAIAQVPRELAFTISKTEPSILWIDNQRVSQIPFYVSQNATDGQLYSVFYQLQAEATNAVTNGEYISVDVPLFVNSGVSTIPYLPIDSVFQTQSENIVFVVEGGEARARKISLGNLFGKYVEVKDGLRRGDRVILNRNVLAGDKISIQ